MPRAYADVIGEFRRGHAGSLAGRGAYDEAIRAAAGDPELMATYQSMGDAARQRQRAETMEGANRTYAQALQGGDYEGAGRVAAKVGNVEAMQGARQARVQHTQEQRLQLLRGAQQGLAELEQIEAKNGQGYEAYRDRARAAVQQNPELDQDLRAFAQSLPDEWNPRVTGTARTLTQRIVDSLLSPEQIAERARNGGGERRFTPASGGILDTFTGEVERNPHYVRSGAAQQGPPDPPPGYVIVE